MLLPAILLRPGICLLRIFENMLAFAGPAGLMAAQRPAQPGLKILLLEKFDAVSRIRRACWQQFVMA